jgi:plastocyanin
MSFHDVRHPIASTDLPLDEQAGQGFDAPGAFEYFCGLHLKMMAEVVVG